MKNIIENSNDWQEIKDEYPKIISFRSSNPNLRPVLTLRKNDLYSITTEEGHITLDNILHQGKSVDSGDYIIYQVAKDKDTIFTIGDKVKYIICKSSTPFIIDNFFFDKVENRILARGKNNGIVEDIITIEKVKDSLFITEDGVVLSEGSTCYSINKSSFLFCSQGDPNIPKDFTPSSDYVYFSTKEKALEWVDLNKPRFSKKQILDIIPELQSNAWRYWEKIIKENLGI